ncbi:MAG: MFS transporter [Acidobacteria bacterium]|nr:MFS transporter [Acidobacteriota bacterium]
MSASTTHTPAPGASIGRYRWTICALLFFATTINYIHRQIFSILAPTLEREIHWTEVEYGYIISAFQGAYAIGLVLLGRAIDRFGTRRGFSFIITIWSLAAMAHALAMSTFGFGAMRFALGLGEAGNFPASIKTVAEWFPKHERAFATGIFNAGSNIGAVVAPAMVPWIALHYGWRWSFVITGAFGFVWLIFWLRIYQKPSEHPRLTKAELDYIQSDADESVEQVSWARLLPLRQTWAFAIGKFLTDPVWWFYLFWVPKFFNKNFGLTLDKIGLPLIIIYLASDIGSVGGGWLSSALLKRGWSENAARKTALAVCAVAVIPIVFAGSASNMWVAVGLLSLATAAHQGWSANLFTLTSDMFPKRAVGSAVGIGGTLGAIGGMMVATAAGFILEVTGSYWSLFIMAGSLYLVALAIIHLLVPRLEPARV